MVLQISLTTSFGQLSVYDWNKQRFCPTEKNLRSVWLDVCLWEGSGGEENSTKRVKDKYFSILWPSFKKGQTSNCCYATFYRGNFHLPFG